MNTLTRYIARRKILMAITKLESICNNRPDITRHTAVLRAAAYEKYPTVCTRTKWRWNLLVAMKILMPVAVKAAVIWHQCDLEFIRNHYPLEWKQAVAVCPELDQIT